jgi:hypothetical protein
MTFDFEIGYDFKFEQFKETVETSGAERSSLTIRGRSYGQRYSLAIAFKTFIHESGVIVGIDHDHCAFSRFDETHHFRLESKIASVMCESRGLVFSIDKQAERIVVPAEEAGFSFA